MQYKINNKLIKLTDKSLKKGPVIKKKRNQGKQCYRKITKYKFFWYGIKIHQIITLYIL